MACEEIRSRVRSLERQEREVEEVLPALQGAGLQAATENLANIRADLAEARAELDECETIASLDPSRPHRAFTARVVRLHCLNAGAEIGKQEPYLIIATVDMRAGAGFVPDLHTVLVGPWQGVRGGSSRPAPAGADPFWDLNGHRKALASPDDAIFLLGLVEHDGASPDAIRGSVQTALRLSLASNLGRDRDTLADTMRSAMVGAIDSSAGAGVAPGHLNFDDRIGVRRLDLTATDLGAVDAFGSTRRTLRFTTTKRSGQVADRYDVDVELAA